MHRSKESGPKGPGLWAAQRERLKAQGTGHKANIIEKKILSPYALRLTPCTLKLFYRQSH